MRSSAWQWRYWRDQRVVPGPCRSRSHRRGSRVRAGAWNQLCQRRPDLAGLRVAVGRAGRAAEGHQVDVPGARAAEHQARMARCSSSSGCGRCCATARRQRYAVNKERMVRLAEYSRDCIRAAARRDRHCLRRPPAGHAQVFRTHAQLEAAARDIAVLEEAGVPYQLLSREELGASEPALAAAGHKLVGGLRLPNDETGDCQLFTQRPGSHGRIARRAVPRTTARSTA